MWDLHTSIFVCLRAALVNICKENIYHGRAPQDPETHSGTATLENRLRGESNLARFRNLAGVSLFSFSSFSFSDVPHHHSEGSSLFVTLSIFRSSTN